MLTRAFVIAPLLALAVGTQIPILQETSLPSPPTFPENNNYIITTEGTKPNQGAHALLSGPGVGRFFAPISGIGSEVTGKGLAWYNPSFTAGNRGYEDPSFYFCFSGIKENFPPIVNWMNFHDMFNLNQNTTLVHFDTGPEQGAIYDAIVQVSQEAKVDARLILAVIMQESSGNVRVPCTNNGIENCGLMQAFTGSVSYDPNNMVASILQMVRDGTQGTAQGPGYVQWISQNIQTEYAGDTEGNVYQAARGYNSGQINFADLSDPKGATGSYVSDLANRLQGWNGASCGNPFWDSCNFPEKAHC
ncbi:unnamed protein product [Tuber melanosporum]|uniref:(Perigord truffle) hypothetical protein n=1 Tax=Tuber melanosporum (strain Mel28) TaxID=656061 RepID=D5GJ16_TUBMM|nr:uncharacterized protein GSTUM_00008776001 [Tuber melanosporum]CAZ84509.1 unnamed protein product [Tuber melanosporum]